MLLAPVYRRNDLENCYKHTFFLNTVTYCVLVVVVLLKHSRKTYHFCLRFGSRAGSVTNSAVVHVTVAMTVSSPTGTAVLRRNWALPLV